MTADETESDGTLGPDDATHGPTCPSCGSSLFERHCKYVCPNHGVVFDCADTFWL